VSNRTHVPVVGIVGGIGSGKSSVARWVASRHSDVLLINGDEVGHEVLTIPAVIEAVRKRFGPEALDASGQVDRRALGQIVFGPQEEQQRARHDLEQIVHPRIRETFKKRIAEAVESGQRAVLLDAAVLFEAGWNDLCHAVVFIDVPRALRLERLRSGRGWNETDVERREKSQQPVEQKRARADCVIDNAGPIESAIEQLEAILTRVREEALS
jgi:dephospho-CoA kinase